MIYSCITVGYLHVSPELPNTAIYKWLYTVKVGLIWAGNAQMFEEGDNLEWKYNS